MSDDVQPPQTKRKPSIIAIVGIIMLAGLCGISGIFAGIVVANWPSTPTPTAISSQPGTPEATPTNIYITSGGVLRRIETTSVLQTTVYRIDTVVRAKKEGSWFFNVGGQNIILFVQGSVTAGVDLDELKESDIEVSQEGRTITITLPPVKILDASLDEYTVETFEGKTPEKVDLTLLQEGLQNGQARIQEIACTDRILERATMDSKRVIGDMMSLVDFDDFVVIVESSLAPECEFDVKVKPVAQ